MNFCPYLLFISIFYAYPSSKHAYLSSSSSYLLISSTYPSIFISSIQIHLLSWFHIERHHIHCFVYPYPYLLSISICWSSIHKLLVAKTSTTKRQQSNLKLQIKTSKLLNKIPGTNQLYNSIDIIVRHNWLLTYSLSNSPCREISNDITFVWVINKRREVRLWLGSQSRRAALVWSFGSVL